MKRQHLGDPNAVDALTPTDSALATDAIVEGDGEQQASSTDEHYPFPFGSRAGAMPCNFGEETGVIPRTIHDRAAVVATAVMHIFATAERRELRQALEDYRREQFAEVQCQTAIDWEPVDA
jgi:hypothetical protein